MEVCEFGITRPTRLWLSSSQRRRQRNFPRPLTTHTSHTMSYARPGGMPLGGAGVRQPSVEYICAGMLIITLVCG